MNNLNNNSYGKIQFIQINLNNCVNATNLLIQNMREQDIDVALIQEPYCADKCVSCVPTDFQVIQLMDRPKAAIIVNPKRVKVMPLIRHTTLSQAWALLNFNHIDIHMCSAYMAPSEDIITSLNDLEFTINELKPQTLIISSDTNAKSKQWFSRCDNRRGYEVIDLYK